MKFTHFLLSRALDLMILSFLSVILEDLIYPWPPQVVQHSPQVRLMICLSFARHWFDNCLLAHRKAWKYLKFLSSFRTSFSTDLLPTHRPTDPTYRVTVFCWPPPHWWLSLIWWPPLVSAELWAVRGHERPRHALSCDEPLCVCRFYAHGLTKGPSVVHDL